MIEIWYVLFMSVKYDYECYVWLGFDMYDYEWYVLVMIMIVRY